MKQSYYSLASAATVLCCAFLWTPTHCYKYHQNRIPNGDFVEHPCRPNRIWYGVGHKHWQGGGANNVFGQDFINNNLTWDNCLCTLDSDGDGQTNGEELGDPLCRWRPGQVPDRTTRITHPGICEPLGSETCHEINTFDVCADIEFECDAINGQGVQSMDLRIPTTSVPADENTRICPIFKLTEQENHIIAWEPLIDNNNVVQSIQVFACLDEDYETDGPGLCSDVQASMPCSRIAAIWTLGSMGNCYGDNYGYHIGPNATTHFVLQIHWHNPEGRTDYTDNSGIRFYYTNVLRPYDLDMVNTGQGVIDIPPGKEAYELVGECGSKCTASLQTPIFLVQAFLHMRYLGTAARIQIYRGGIEVARALDLTEHFHDEPAVVNIQPPIELKPGDDVRVTCVYNTMSKKTYTHFSWSTTEEMCFGFLTYYPSDSGIGRGCIGWGPDYKGCDEYPSDMLPVDCVINDFLQPQILNPLLADLENNCAVDICLPGCEAAIGRVSNHACLSEGIGSYALTSIRGLGQAGIDFSHRMHSCSVDIDESVNTPAQQHGLSLQR